MPRTVTIEPVTRIEGHARIRIRLDESGAVDDARVEITSLRGFEQFVIGRPAEELPRIVSRICGVCPWMHHLAAARAVDGCFAVEPPPAGRLLRELSPEAARTLLGTVIIIFAFRALPGPGAGASWWMIDELGFDQSFLSRLDLITSALTLAGLFLFRRFMAEKSIAQIVIFLTVATTALSLPIIGMFHGLHEWTAAHTGGVVDARFIAIANTALESPLGQVSMVPMLAWIANSAPPHLKATFFAVMASFTNLALSASQLGTKYLNQIYTIAREVKDAATGAITTPADYGALGELLVTVTVIALVVPLAAILLTRLAGLRSA